MNGTWWVGQGDLDEDQRKIISVPLDHSLLITGPPGSGKTNLLLLRANYLYLAGLRNIIIVTFTRSLKEFIVSGATQYEFPRTKILTCREWQNDLLRQYGIDINTSGNFEKDRQNFLTAMNELVENLNLLNLYDAILLDEAQDYTSEEIRLFEKLSERLVCVADERQKIYDGDESIGLIKDIVNQEYDLQYHYRNGVKICRIADEIAKKWRNYQPLEETANYNEKANPSTVDFLKCSSIDEQAKSILSRLDTQRVAFPNQLIGVLCPKKESVQAIWEAINFSQHSDSSFLVHGDSSDAFLQGKQILVSTFHAAKGLEFRALHLACCDELKAFKNNRRVIFTAVTRAKTVLSVYYTNDLHGYFDMALHKLDDTPKKTPTLEDVFGGTQ